MNSNQPYRFFFRNTWLALVLVLFTISCSKDPAQNDAELLETDAGVPGTLSISYTLPGDLPANASEKQIAEFAWNEFFALNWQSSWASDKRRTNPNTSWSFASESYPDLAVWETYVHRSELRPEAEPLPDISGSLPVYNYRESVNPNGLELSDFWNNLDEDNEIGSCYLLAYDSLEVLYMAKTNLDEYDYFRNNLPNNTAVTAAVKNGKSLEYLINRSRDQACNSDTAKNVICLPCGDVGVEGAIEIKTAWRFLVPGLDDPSRFIQKEVLYYTDENGQLTAQKGTMALIGMHIIRKMKNFPAFVFASFEQVDVRDSYTPPGSDTQTSIMNYYGFKGNSFDPQKSTPVVPRDISPTIQGVNNEAKSLITETNDASLLQYYRLIGVQGIPINYDQRMQDPNYFMANYVIESDSMLTFFRGSFAHPTNDTIKNVVFSGETFAMGGCQGCHGQAQLAGTDFSFIAGSGAGNPIKEPDILQSVEEIRKSVGDIDAVKDFISSLE